MQDMKLLQKFSSILIIVTINIVIYNPQKCTWKTK